MQTTTWTPHTPRRRMRRRTAERRAQAVLARVCAMSVQAIGACHVAALRSGSGKVKSCAPSTRWSTPTGRFIPRAAWRDSGPGDVQRRGKLVRQSACVNAHSMSEPSIDGASRRPRKGAMVDTPSIGCRIGPSGSARQPIRRAGPPFGRLDPRYAPPFRGRGFGPLKKAATVGSCEKSPTRPLREGAARLQRPKANDPHPEAAQAWYRSATKSAADAAADVAATAAWPRRRPSSRKSARPSPEISKLAADDLPEVPRLVRAGRGGLLEGRADPRQAPSARARTCQVTDV